MPGQRRLWDSNVILNYLAGKDEYREAVEGILDEAAAGNLEIVASTLAIAEVAYLEGMQDSTAAVLIQEFFSREYVVIAAVDEGIARAAQESSENIAGK